MISTQQTKPKPAKGGTDTLQAAGAKIPRVYQRPEPDQTSVGDAYYHTIERLGYGVTKDQVEAGLCYRKAAIPSPIETLLLDESASDVGNRRSTTLYPR